ncbi:MULTISPECIES: acetamidase/formamidase family protein [unclassified Pseudomonas]|uniref:acetamidase/formamidase family protein n=1 Tax=unclassified Pseudomonas TaxID=196821 RepID=UPI0012950C6F|nr:MULTISPECIES: acetamidase/formamidase family protein [unclassified Pseudomonas]MQT42981.1 hypothetical protein [Pseudomonas sp. FSL R10-0765]MQT53704.1 hypothetical protein [Pseudomonas sp. FSL R10-2398]MQU03081.1 hypothetical protein [Pseudomonas sp. FSL R10-2245]MQU11699.1 hypothetical protein [Pseudomonas sp. FSL R10-2189]MQU37472.1 hypothetical protein [Pseudomonas sp. FSL R10-2172]
MKLISEVDDLPRQKKYYQSFSGRESDFYSLKPGRAYATRTIDNLGFDECLDRVSTYFNPLSGPYFLEGSKCGDVLAITVLDIRITRNVGLSSQGILPEFINEKYSQPVVGEEVICWQITGDRGIPVSQSDTGLSLLSVRQELMIGCIRCSDPVGKGEGLSSIDADEYGGNVDCTFFKKGATLFLPVAHDNAFFYMGDIHFNQGMGEVGGSGIEVSGEIVFSVDKCSQPLHSCLHIDVGGFIYFLGVNENFNASVRLAYGYAFEALLGNGMAESVARLLLGHCASLHVMKLGVPNVVVVGVESAVFIKK